jgi:purine-binding chemotaxis protein CheW
VSKDREKAPPVFAWQEIRRRLTAAAADLEQGREPSPGERKRLLAERARGLAREPAIEEPGVRLGIVEFQLAHERYGVDSSLVAEVFPLREYTPVPCTPAFVLGIVNVRGRIVSVLDLKKFFDLPAKGLTDLNRVLVLRSPQMEFGLMADSIAGTRQVRQDELQSGLPTLTGIRDEYLKGVAGDGLIVLDAERMLADPGLVVREEVG